MNTPQCTTCRDMQCKGGFYCLVNIEKAAHIANMMQLEGVDYTRGYQDGARIHQNAYEDGYKAATSTEYLRCKFHCEQAVREFREMAVELIREAINDVYLQGGPLLLQRINRYERIINEMWKLPITTSKEV